jgi:hypothetical protein
MNPPTRNCAAQFAGVALAAFASTAVAAGLAGPPNDDPRVAIVVAGRAAEQPAALLRARTLASSEHAQLRVTHTTADQLGVTHRLAAEGYDEVRTLGVDRRIAIEPVHRRFPETRFVEVSLPR